MSDAPKLGKNIMDNLAYSMYPDARDIFREYIQNATDSIDNAQKNNMFPNEDMEINIKIDTDKRYISIEDNAVGIRREDVPRLLATIADSTKKQTENRGFRGIGRLGGLAYCRELRFVTTYKGESEKTIMIWNARQMKQKGHSDSYHEDMGKLLGETISYQYEPCEASKHGFKVELIDINPENYQKLLDVSFVKDYLCEVAPVEFGQKFFMYRSKIYNFVEAHRNELEPLRIYSIYLTQVKRGREHTEQIFKPYTTRIYKLDRNTGIKKQVDEVKDVYPDIIRDPDTNEAVAWIWFSISEFHGQINEVGNPMRCLRIRQHNIEIGNQKTVTNHQFFKETRGSGYFFGEIHTNMPKLRPNARRDYFDDSTELVRFEMAVKQYISENLDGLYNEASNLNSKYRDIARYYETVKRIQQAESGKKPFTTPKEEDETRKSLSGLKKKAKSATSTIQNIKRKSDERHGTPYNSMVNTINRGKKGIDISRIREQLEKNDIPKPVNEDTGDYNPKQTTDKKPSKRKVIADELSYLNRSERKLLTKVYDIIRDNLSPTESVGLIQKIQKGLELKKKDES